MLGVDHGAPGAVRPSETRIAEVDNELFLRVYRQELTAVHQSTPLVGTRLLLGQWTLRKIGIVIFLALGITMILITKRSMPSRDADERSLPLKIDQPVSAASSTGAPTSPLPQLSNAAQRPAEITPSADEVVRLKVRNRRLEATIQALRERTKTAGR